MILVDLFGRSPISLSVAKCGGRIDSHQNLMFVGGRTEIISLPMKFNRVMKKVLCAGAAFCHGL